MDVQRSFDRNFAGLEHDTYEQRERGHGREEFRRYTVLYHTAALRNGAAGAGF